jgi:hypothetical protein
MKDLLFYTINDLIAVVTLAGLANAFLKFFVVTLGSKDKLPD